MTALMTRSEMEEKLREVFAPEQTASLVEVLDNIRQVELERAADTRDLKHGLRELTEEVKKLATAQRHTDERLAELTVAQRRTDERLAELATAQRHTDERVAELATAQRHTDERLAELSRAVQTLAETVHTGLTELREAVGSLANTFGFSLEEFVAALLPPYLERYAAITDLSLERRYFEVAKGQQEEVDLVGTGRRDGQPVTVLAECRTTLKGGEMRRLARKLAAVAATLTDREVLKVVVAMNLHPTGEKVARETGIWAIPYSRINRERSSY